MHLTDQVKPRLQETKTVLAVVPDGLTSIIQPLEMCPLINLLRQVLQNFIHNGCAVVTMHTMSGKLKRPRVSLVLEWIVNTWKAVKCETVIKRLKKCAISNNLDGTENCALWDMAEYLSLIHI